MIGRTWTIIYGGAAATAFGAMMLLAFELPIPWYIQLAVYMYVFISAGFICMGRIEARKQQREQINMLIRISKENSQKAKRRLN